MLTLQDAIEKMVVSDEADEQVYGRLLAAIGDSLQVWFNDEIQRNREPSDVLFALMRTMACMVNCIYMNMSDMDEEALSRSLRGLSDGFYELTMMAYKKFKNSPEELAAAIVRAMAQQEGAGQIKQQ